MLKRFVILSVVVFGLLPIYGQEKTAKPYPEQKKSKPIEKKEPQPAPAPVAAPVSKETSQGKNNNTDNHPAGYFSRLISPENVSNVGLFFIGLISSIIALRTLFKIERQTKAGEDAAKAALLSAQAVINAERPWLLVTIESVNGPMGGFNIFAKNKGRTPAMITAAHIGSVRVENISYLPEKPPYGLGSMVENLIVMPDERPLIRWVSDKVLSKMLKDSPIPAWEEQTFIFGIVLYRDLADPTPNRIHETRWISLYQGPSEFEDVDPIFQIEGIGVSEAYAKYS